MQTIRLAQGVEGAFLDALEVDPCGLVRVVGWCRGAPDDAGIEVRVNDEPLRRLATYRTWRPDVARALSVEDEFLGFAVEHLARPASGVVEHVRVRAGGRAVLGRPLRLAVQVPAYDHLLSEERVLGRDGIYGFGPPGETVDPQVVPLIASLRGPVLDVGCGGGALVRTLRGRGVEALGLEVDRPGIRDALRDDVRPHVHLYDGSLPLPFGDGSFAEATAIEVLEHLPALEPVVAEIARVVRDRFVATVPDISAIPVLCQHGVVPWHLLESTHLSFFTQASFTRLLGRFFRKVEAVRIGRGIVNGTAYTIGLAAVCTK